MTSLFEVTTQQQTNASKLRHDMNYKATSKTNKHKERYKQQDYRNTNIFIYSVYFSGTVIIKVSVGEIVDL